MSESFLEILASTNRNNLSAVDRSKIAAENAKFIAGGSDYLARVAQAQIKGASGLLHSQAGMNPAQKFSLNEIVKRTTENLADVATFSKESEAVNTKIQKLNSEAQVAFKRGMYGSAQKFADEADLALSGLMDKTKLLARNLSQVDRLEATLAQQGVFVTERYKKQDPNMTVQVVDSFLASSIKGPMYLASKVINNPETSIRVVRDIGLLTACAEPLGIGAGFAMGVTGQKIIEGVSRGKLDWELPLIYLVTGAASFFHMLKDTAAGGPTGTAGGAVMLLSSAAVGRAAGSTAGYLIGHSTAGAFPAQKFGTSNSGGRNTLTEETKAELNQPMQMAREHKKPPRQAPAKVHGARNGNNSPYRPDIPLKPNSSANFKPPAKVPKVSGDEKVFYFTDMNKYSPKEAPVAFRGAVGEFGITIKVSGKDHVRLSCSVKLSDSRQISFSFEGVSPTKLLQNLGNPRLQSNDKQVVELLKDKLDGLKGVQLKYRPFPDTNPAFEVPFGLNSPTSFRLRLPNGNSFRVSPSESTSGRFDIYHLKSGAKLEEKIFSGIEANQVQGQIGALNKMATKLNPEDSTKFETILNVASAFTKGFAP